MKTGHITLALILVLPLTASAGDAVKVQEVRQHFDIQAAKDVTLYEFTRILRLSDEIDETVILVRDEGHGDYLLRHTWSFPTQTVTYRISDAKDRSFVQLSYKAPYTSKTRLETLTEAKRSPQVVETAPALVTIETSGGKWEGFETDFYAYARLREFRNNIRRTMDFTLLEAIERMRGTLFTAQPAQIFYLQIGRFIVYDGGRDGEPLQTGLSIRDMEPHCAFDGSLGYKCSEKQLERIAKAQEEGKTLVRY